MAVRAVKPFSAKQWTMLVEDMEHGPTVEQIKKVNKAIAQTDSIPYEDD